MIRLTTSNYPIWKLRMGDMLCCHILEDTILGDNGAKPSNVINEKRKKNWTWNWLTELANGLITCLICCLWD